MNNEIIVTGDGSWTLYSAEYSETYHSMSGAVAEALEKFCRPCQIENLALSQKKLRILDVCFGLGYNALAAWHLVKAVNPRTELEIITLEKDADLINRLTTLGLPAPLTAYQPIITALAKDRIYREENRTLKLILGDATQTIPTLQEQFHAVFWDPFSPPKNPEMWTGQLFAQVRPLMLPQAILATYSSNQRVRKGFLSAGFKIGLGPAVGRKTGGTLVSLAAALPPLAEKDLAKLALVEPF